MRRARAFGLVRDAEIGRTDLRMDGGEVPLASENGPWTELTGGLLLALGLTMIGINVFGWGAWPGALRGEQGVSGWRARTGASAAASATGQS